KRGLEALKDAIVAACEQKPVERPVFPGAFETEVCTLRELLRNQPGTEGNGDLHPDFLMRRLLLDVNGYAERRLNDRHGVSVVEAVHASRQRLAKAGSPVPAVEARTRYAWIRQRVEGCVARQPRPAGTWSDRIDRVLTHRVFGLLCFLALMFLVFAS